MARADFRPRRMNLFQYGSIGRAMLVPNPPFAGITHKGHCAWISLHYDQRYGPPQFYLAPRARCCLARMWRR